MDKCGQKRSIATYGVGVVDFFRLPLVVGSIAEDRDGTVAGPTGKHLAEISIIKQCSRRLKKMMHKTESLVQLTRPKS